MLTQRMAMQDSGSTGQVSGAVEASNRSGGLMLGLSSAQASMLSKHSSIASVGCHLYFGNDGEKKAAC